MSKFDWKKPTKLTLRQVILIFILCTAGEIIFLYLIFINPVILIEDRFTIIIPLVIPFIMWLIWQQYKGKI